MVTPRLGIPSDRPQRQERERQRRLPSVPLTSRAVADLDVRAVDADQRTIEGIATTPTIDHLGDVIDPEGVRYTLPHKLLWMHRHEDAVGWVTHAAVSKAGIRIKAKLARIEEPGLLRDLTERAWQSVKAGLVDELSVGFKPISYEPLKGSKGGLRYKVWRWFETSLVGIGANPGAKILTTKGASDMLIAELSPAVAEIMRRFEAEQAAKEAEQLERLARERGQAAERLVERPPVDLEKHMAKRLRHELGRNAFDIPGPSRKPRA